MSEESFLLKLNKEKKKNLCTNFYCEPQLFLFEIGCELEVVFCLLSKSLKYSLGRE